MGRLLQTQRHFLQHRRNGDYKNKTSEGENQTETFFPELFHPNTRNHAQVQQEISEAQARGADRLGDGRKGGQHGDRARRQWRD